MHAGVSPITMRSSCVALGGVARLPLSPSISRRAARMAPWAVWTSTLEVGVIDPEPRVSRLRPMFVVSVYRQPDRSMGTRQVIAKAESSSVDAAATFSCARVPDSALVNPGHVRDWVRGAPSPHRSTLAEHALMLLRVLPKCAIKHPHADACGLGQ